jgi:uncharacterized protein YybS (DUF2232 family)
VSSGRSTRAITEGAMLIGVTVVIAFASRYVPLLSLFLAMPMAFVVVRHGLGAGVLAGSVATLMLFAFMGVAALGTVAEVIIAGLALGMAHQRFSDRPLAAFLVTAVGYVISFVVILYVAARILGIADATPTAYIDGFLETYDRLMDQIGEFGAPAASLDVSLIRPYLIMSIPALIGLSAAGNAAVVFWLFRRLSPRFGYKVAAIPPFRQWHLNWTYGWGFVLGFLLLTVGGYLQHDVLLRIGLNVFGVFYTVFLVQGFSVIANYLSHWSVSTGAKVLMVVLAVITGLAQLAMVVAPWLGVLDAWFDFRKLEVASDESDPDSRPQG